MKKILLPILSLILAACSSSQVAVTRSAQVTVASLPPTATPISTPTLHPQFVALQTQIAASGERFTLASDGTIQDGATVVPGLSVDKNGVITLQGQSLPAQAGSQVTISPEDVSFDDTKGVTIKGYTLDKESGKWGVETMIIEYDVVKNPYEFRSCKLTPEQIPDYVKSLKKYHGRDRSYDQDKLMFNPLVKMFGNEILYDLYAPNYIDPESRPFERGAYCLMQFASPEGKNIDYIVSFVQYYQKELTPEEYPWLVFVAQTIPAVDKAMIDAYIHDMYFPVMITDNISQSGVIVGADPLVNITFEKFPDMNARFDSAMAGDFTKLDGEQGIILETIIRGTDGDEYK